MTQKQTSKQENMPPWQNIIRVLSKLDIYYREMSENYCPEDDEIDGSLAFQRRHNMAGWEVFWLPERQYYDGVLSHVTEDDVIFDIGAGDFRLDLQMAYLCKKVYAVEINPSIVSPALGIIGYDLPPNLLVICADAFRVPLPKDVTMITCLMIHRQKAFPPDFLTKKLIYATHDGLVKHNVH